MCSVVQGPVQFSTCSRQESRESACFDAGQCGESTQHIFDTLLTGRVFPKDEYRKSSILALSRSR